MQLVRNICHAVNAYSGEEIMEQGKNIFTMEFKSERIKGFEKKILTQGLCKAFLPMSFVCFGEIERVSYNSSGYKSLANYEVKISKELIYLLEKCVFALLDCCEYLINPKKIELSPETVFYSDCKKEIRFAYFPKEIVSQSVLHNFLELVRHIEQTEKDKEMSDYLKATASYIEYSNGGMIDVINYLGELKQEIHACE